MHQDLLAAMFGDEVATVAGQAGESRERVLSFITK
jgi:hypothetical protein